MAAVAEPVSLELPPPAAASPGFTTRIMTGSVWAIAGQVLTLVATLVATPFTIRALGPELYGILTLIWLVVGYAAFADLGMGMASTKFAAEANAEVDRDGESQAIWTSLMIALLGTVLIGCLVAVLARPILKYIFDFPQHLIGVAAISLQIAMLGLLARTLASILNTPQMVRLRLDLNVSINTVTALMQILLVPAILLLGYGLPAAVGVTVGTAILNAGLHAVFSSRLLPELKRVQLRRELFRPLARFGAGIVASTVLAVALLNIEKLLLARYESPTALAYYAVATTLATLITYAPGALTNSLLPVFAHFRKSGDMQGLQLLYTRALRVILVGTAPVVVVVAANARPFLSVWAGPDYARHSTLPLYLLLVGIVAQVLNRVPKEIVKTYGRTDLFPKFLAWQVLPYLAAAVLLTITFGINGAAAAWSLRFIGDTILLFQASRRLSGLRLSPFPRPAGPLIALVVLSPPLVAIPLLAPATWTVPLLLSVLSVSAYSYVTWRYVLNADERQWMFRAIENARRRLRRA